MARYFLAALTIPDGRRWVNLSPYEKDRIIAQDFGKTEMGKDLLEQDYLLKQLTASLTFPETESGRKYWDRVYAQIQERLGTTKVVVNGFHKVWIVPDKAVVYERGNTAYIVESHLNVMLEQDYLALEKNSGDALKGLEKVDEQTKIIHEIQSQAVRDLLLPYIEKEVNSGRTFANLRQIYKAMILASWYKRNVLGGVLNQAYVDQAKTPGVESKNPGVNDQIYQQYIDALQKGVFNYIKKDYDKASQNVIPRQYFSGGSLDKGNITTTRATLPKTTLPLGAQRIQLKLLPASSSPRLNWRLYDNNENDWLDPSQQPVDDSDERWRHHPTAPTDIETPIKPDYGVPGENPDPDTIIIDDVEIHPHILSPQNIIPTTEQQWLNLPPNFILGLDNRPEAITLASLGTATPMRLTDDNPLKNISDDDLDPSIPEHVDEIRRRKEEIWDDLFDTLIFEIIKEIDENNPPAEAKSGDGASSPILAAPAGAVSLTGNDEMSDLNPTEDVPGNGTEGPEREYGAPDDHGPATKDGSEKQPDEAMVVGQLAMAKSITTPDKRKLGGIDMNAELLNLQTQSGGVGPIQIRQRLLSPFQSSLLNGLTPLIENIEPANVLALLGLDNTIQNPVPEHFTQPADRLRKKEETEEPSPQV